MIFNKSQGMSKLIKEFSRKRKTKNPCPGCFLHLELCLCSLVPSLKLKTRLNLVIHHREMKRTSNTGQLAIKALVNSKLHIRGVKEQALQLDNILKDEFETLLLYPSDDAVLLTPEYVKSITKPVQIIVPDGNWRQASKVHTRHKELSEVKRVKVARVGVDPYHLRQESTDNGMATLQAIAYAFGALEGQEVQDRLLELYERKLVRTLIGRGKLPISHII